MLKHALAHLLRCQPAVLEQFERIAVEFTLDMGEGVMWELTTHGERRLELCIHHAAGVRTNMDY